MADHKNVYMAPAAAQSEMDKAVKDAVNPAFRSKYADLSSVVDAVRPALNKNGIAFFHIPVSDNLGHRMKTVLCHGASETQIECDVPLIFGKNDMQGYKSATTYAKRIGLESVTGIAPEDDDGTPRLRRPRRPALFRAKLWKTLGVTAFWTAFRKTPHRARRPRHSPSFSALTSRVRASRHSKIAGRSIRRQSSRSRSATQTWASRSWMPSRPARMKSPRITAPPKGLQHNEWIRQ